MFRNASSISRPPAKRRRRSDACRHGRSGFRPTSTAASRTRSCTRSRISISGSTRSSPWWANHRGSAPLNSAGFSHTSHSSRGAGATDQSISYNGRVMRGLTRQWRSVSSVFALIGLSVVLGMGPTPRAAPSQNGPVPLRTASTTTRPQDSCPVEWREWDTAQGGPFKFQYRSGSGSRPPGSPYAPLCQQYELRDSPTKLAVSVKWFAQDSRTVLYQADVEQCIDSSQDRCPVSSSARKDAFSSIVLPSLLRFAGRPPEQGDPEVTGDAWQRRPDQIQQSGSLPIFSAAARGVVLNADRKVEFRYAFHAYSSATRTSDGWTVVNEIERDNPELQLPKSFVIGQTTLNPGVTDATLMWTVPLANGAARQQTPNGLRTTSTVKQPVVADSRLEIRVRGEVHFAMTVSAYVDAAQRPQ